jgi:GDPmannose 4,6-dehydratase
LKTAIITGVTGQDGSYLAEHLINIGYRVVGLKRRTSVICTDRIDHIFAHKNFNLEYFELDDPGVIYRIINKYNPDEIYNLAAQSHVRVSFDTPLSTTNTIVTGVTNVLEAIRNTNRNIKFYQASSSEMFGDNPEVPQNENTKLQPASPYACAKVYSHHLTRNYRESYNIFACSGILFNHESPRRGETFVTRKITLAAARIKLGLQDKLCLGNLDAMRDWGYAKDYVRAMHLMMQHPTPDDYVIATGKSHTVKNWLEEVFDIADLSIGDFVETDERLFRPHEVPHLLGDASKAKKILNWQAKTDFKSLAKIMYESDLSYVKSKI